MTEKKYNHVTFKKFLARLGSVSDKEVFAAKVGTSIGYLQHIANGRKRAGGRLAINIEKESGGLVPADAVCPDADWDFIRSSASKVPDSTPPNPQSPHVNDPPKP